MQLSDSVSIIQWLFDLEVFCKGFNWPVHVEALVTAKRQMDLAVSTKALAEEVLDAYQKFAGAIGPTVMNALLESDDAFPEVNHSNKLTPHSPGKVTLYTDRRGQRVLAICTSEWGMPPQLFVE